MNQNNSGKLRGIYLPFILDEMTEKTRKKLGMNRSRFIQYCLLKTLQELSVVSEKAHSPNNIIEQDRVTKNES